MTATNHVLTGAVIGLTVNQPPFALLIAIASHFVLDALPHYGDNSHTKKRFLFVLGTDMAAASFVLVALVILRPTHWQLAFVCAIAAASPDLMWLPMWIRELRHVPQKTTNALMRFHKKIQWAEKSKNYPIEVLWATVCCFLLINKL